jgi:hypothetical protein
MKKIVMSKYGFIRWPERDFNDDGAKFICFKVGERVEVSKTTYKGDAFIDCYIQGTKLPYEVYSKLPHYSAISRLNCVPIESLTDQDLLDLYEACLAYEQEYTEAENNIQMPSASEIKAQCQNIQAKRTTEYEEIEQLLNSNAAKLATELESWQWKTFKEYFVKLAAERAKYNPELFIPTILGTARSINFCKPDYIELDSCYYYNYLMNLIKSVQG